MKNRMIYWAYKLAYPHAMLFLYIAYPMNWILHFIPKLKVECERYMKRTKEGLPTLECRYGLDMAAAVFSLPLFLIVMKLLSHLSCLNTYIVLILSAAPTVLPAFWIYFKVYYGTDSDEYIKMIAKESRKQHVIWALISFGVPAILFCIGFYVLFKK